jgi:hypothetical protein
MWSASLTCNVTLEQECSWLTGKESNTNCYQGTQNQFSEIGFRAQFRAYTFASSGRLIPLAFGVLSTHAATAYGHFLFTFGDDSRSTRAWSDLVEFVALAVQSESTDLLRHTGASNESS